MHNTILLIGATGTTGMALGEALQARGLRFRALVRNPAAATALKELGAELMQGDLADPSSVAAACEGVAQIYLAHSAHPDLRDWCQNVTAAATDAGVRQIVRLSAMNADSNSETRLLKLHGLADAGLRASDLGWTILRPNAFMQNLLAQAPVIAGSGNFYLPAGESTQSLIDARDIADAAAAILADSAAHAGEIYTLTGSESLSYHDVAAQLSDALGTAINYVPVREEDACRALRAAGLPEWASEAIAELQAQFATGGFASVTDNQSLLTGNAPRPFSEFVSDTTEAFRAS